MAPRDVEVAAGDEMQDIVVASRIADGTANRWGLQMSYDRGCRLEPFQARGALVFEAAMAVVTVVKVRLEVLAKESFVAVTLSGNSLGWIKEELRYSLALVVWTLPLPSESVRLKLDPLHLPSN